MPHKMMKSPWISKVSKTVVQILKHQDMTAMYDSFPLANKSQRSNTRVYTGNKPIISWQKPTGDKKKFRK